MGSGRIARQSVPKRHNASNSENTCGKRGIEVEIFLFESRMVQGFSDLETGLGMIYHSQTSF